MRYHYFELAAIFLIICFRSFSKDEGKDRDRDLSKKSPGPGQPWPTVVTPGLLKNVDKV